MLFCLLLSLALTLHQVISIRSSGGPVSDTIRKLNPHRAAFLSQLLKGHHSPLLYLQICACVRVFRYHSSEIAPSKRAPGAREAPDATLTRMSTSTRSNSPTNDYHTEYRMRFPYAQKYEMRGRRRDRDSRRGRGEGS